MSEEGFRVLASSVDSDRQEWLRLWAEWPTREVFAHPAYLDHFADSGARSCLAVGDFGSVRVLYPFHLRTVPHGLNSSSTDLTDIASPYGYGGPYAVGAGERAAAAPPFWSDFASWSAEHGVVSEFIRFDLHEERSLPYPGYAEVRSMNVIRSLNLEEDALWMDVNHKVRKNVKRARSLGLEVSVDATGAHVEEFCRIYAATMERRSAPTSYRFSLDWFRSLLSAMPGMWVFFHILNSERIVASELVLRSAESAYSFLGGTESASFEMRPNDLLKWEAFRWAQDAGLSEFVLGGGWLPDDGIFRYKASFAPRGLVPFRIGHRVLDPNAYEALSEAAALARGAPSDASFFPAYRAN